MRVDPDKDPSMKTYVTRSDVAERAGTSTAVVSYVVNGGPRPVAAATRRRVEEAIRDLGYVPDRGAQALAGARKFTCGFLLPDITNPYFALLARALQNEAKTHRLTLLIGDSADDKDEERALLDAFLGQRVDALIVAGVDESSQLEAIARVGVPVVMLDRVREDWGFSSVCIDNDAAASTATEVLIQAGRRRIGYVGGPEGLGVSGLRRAGFRSALEAHGFACAPAWDFSGRFSKRMGYEIGVRIAELSERPDGLFVSSDQQAIGLIAAFAERGIDIPGDIAVVSLDGTDDSRFTVPSLTSVQQPVEEIARRTIDLLTRVGRDEVVHITVPHLLVSGRSAGDTSYSTSLQGRSDAPTHSKRRGS